MPEVLVPKREPAGEAVSRPSTVAEAVLAQLRLWGVKRIYGVIGDAIFGLMDAIARQEDLLFVAVRHESAAALMASAEAKLTGRISVCVSQMGPGLANLLVGLGDAYMDRARVLAITGQVPTTKLGLPHKQYINQQEMVQAVSGHSRLVIQPETAIYGLQEAMVFSQLNRTVAHLSIPEDLFTMPTSVQPQPPPVIPQAEARPAVLERTLTLMRQAAKPMILVGHLAGSDRREQGEAVIRLAEGWGAGMAMGYGAIGIVPDRHPLMVNGVGEGGNPLLPPIFRQADIVLALEPGWWPKTQVPTHAQVIQVADRAEGLATAMPQAVGLVGNTSQALRQLAAALKGFQPNRRWLDQIQQCKEAWLVQNRAEGQQTQTPLHPAHIIRCIEQTADADAIITLDEGNSTLWFLRNFRAQAQHVLLSSRWRTMGFGLPAAIAAKLSQPKRQVVCITGDGGLGMVLADLVTAARYALPITVILLQNDTLQMEQDKMLLKGLQPAGTVLTNPDFVKIAAANGWHAQRIDNGQQLVPALQTALAGNQPALLCVQTARVTYPEFSRS